MQILQAGMVQCNKEKGSVGHNMTARMACQFALAVALSGAGMAHATADRQGSVPQARLGSVLAYAGDFNGDGLGDYVVGMPGYGVQAGGDRGILKNAGRVEVVSGADGGLLATLDGRGAGDALGSAVAGGADINHDGFADVVAGAPGAATEAGVAQAGSVSVLFGGAAGQSPYAFYGGRKAAMAGFALALGDVNGDHYADIVIGAPGDKNPQYVDSDLHGSVSVFSGADLSLLKIFYGTESRARAGSSVAIGDVNGDGSVDIAYGAPYEKKYVYDGSILLSALKKASVICSCESTPSHDVTEIPNAGAVYARSMQDDKFLYIGIGKHAGDRLGKSLLVVDTNQDGKAEIVYGVPGFRKGGKLVGSLEIATAGSLQVVRIVGSQQTSGLGNSLAGGDVDGDGFADIVAGMARKDVRLRRRTLPDAGSVSVWSGKDHGLIASASGSKANDFLGKAIGVGDMNADGIDDVIIGIPGFDVPADKPIKNAGAVKIWPVVVTVN